MSQQVAPLPPRQATLRSGQSALPAGQSALRAGLASPPAGLAAPYVPAAAIPPHLVKIDGLGVLSVPQIRKALKARGLPTKGKKVSACLCVTCFSDVRFGVRGSKLYAILYLNLSLLYVGGSTPSFKQHANMYSADIRAAELHVIL